MCNICKKTEEFIELLSENESTVEQCQQFYDMFSANIDLNGVAENNFTALHIISFLGYKEKLLWLLDKDVNVMALEENNTIALTYFVSLQYDLEVVQKFIDKGSDPLSTDLKGLNPINTFLEQISLLENPNDAPVGELVSILATMLRPVKSRLPATLDKEASEFGELPYTVFGKAMLLLDSEDSSDNKTEETPVTQPRSKRI